MSNYSKEERDVIALATNGKCGKCGKELGEDFCIKRIDPTLSEEEETLVNLVGVCEDCIKEEENAWVDPLIRFPYITKSSAEDVECAYVDKISDVTLELTRENMMVADICQGALIEEVNTNTSADAMQKKMGSMKGGKGKARGMNKAMHGKNSVIHKMSTQSGTISIRISRAVYTDLELLSEMYAQEFKKETGGNLGTTKAREILEAEYLNYPMYTINKRKEVIGFFVLKPCGVFKDKDLYCLCLDKLTLKYMKTAEYATGTVIKFVKRVLTVGKFEGEYIACTYDFFSKANVLLASLLSRSGDTLFMEGKKVVSLVSGEKLYYKDASYILNCMKESPAENQEWIKGQIHGEIGYLLSSSEWDGEKVLCKSVRQSTRERIESENEGLDKNIEQSDSLSEELQRIAEDLSK